MKRIRPPGEEWRNHITLVEEETRGGGTASWGLWLKATSFLCDRSLVHVIRQGRVAGGAWHPPPLLHLIHG